MTTSAEMPLDAFDTSCVSVLGFGDNTADVYDHTNTMYPGGQCRKLCRRMQTPWCWSQCIYGYFWQ